MAAPSLLLGVLQLLDQAPSAPLSGKTYSLTASSDGSSWGNAAKIVTAIRSHLQDGSLAAVTSSDNREGKIRLMVESATYDGLAQAEADLMAQTKVIGYNTLTWNPNPALARSTVFDVVYSYLDHEMDDFGEVVLRRTYTLTLGLLPFGRDVALTTVVLPAAAGTTPTVTSVNDGSSTTGWSSPSGVSTVSGAITVPTSGAPNNNNVVTLAQSYSVSGTPVVFIDWAYLSPTAGTPGTPSLTMNGLPALVAGSGVAGSAGYTRTYFQIPISVATVTTMTLTTTSSLTGTLSVDQVSRASGLPVYGTGKQRSRTLAMGGSARARVGLVLTADTTKTLGEATLVYTRSAGNGFQPPLRPYKIGAAGTADAAAAVSGFYEANTLTTPVYYRIPAVRFKEAMHGLLTRTRATVAGTYTLTYSAVLRTSAGATLPETSQVATGTVTVTYASANVYQINELGILSLPTVPVGPDSINSIELSITSSSNNIQLDESWLFDLDNGSLSWVDTTAFTRLEIRTADLLYPEPTYWGAVADTGPASNLTRADYRVISFGTHTFEPGIVDVFTVTPGTEGSAAQASYFRCWHTYAGA